MSNARQKCPICDFSNDVSIYVTGQKAKCSRCGILFEVRRSESFNGDEGAVSGKRKSPPSCEKEKETLIYSDIPQINGYEIIGVLGKGGMGSVYKARQLSLNRLVAIKVLKKEYAKEKDFILRFSREAEVLARLSHPNIVPIIDKGSTGGLFYFVMEFIDGETLRQKLRSGRLSLDEAIRYTIQILRAISFAHKQNVIHRDLKPENVLIDTTGNVRIADFGLADIVGIQNDYSLTGSGMAMGTAHYMAPEQRRDAKRVDRRADIYSLGVTLYEMLAGEIPQGNYKRICQIRMDINPAFDTIIEKAISSRVEERYQSAEEMSTAIRAAIISEDRKETFVPQAIKEGTEDLFEVRLYAPAPSNDKKRSRLILFSVISAAIVLAVVVILIWALR